MFFWAFFWTDAWSISIFLLPEARFWVFFGLQKAFGLLQAKKIPKTGLRPKWPCRSTKFFLSFLMMILSCISPWNITWIVSVNQWNWIALFLMPNITFQLRKLGQNLENRICLLHILQNYLDNPGSGSCMNHAGDFTLSPPIPLYITAQWWRTASMDALWQCPRGCGPPLYVQISFLLCMESCIYAILIPLRTNCLSFHSCQV